MKADLSHRSQFSGFGLVAMLSCTVRSLSAVHFTPMLPHTAPVTQCSQAPPGGAGLLTRFIACERERDRELEDRYTHTQVRALYGEGTCFCGATHPHLVLWPSVPKEAKRLLRAGGLSPPREGVPASQGLPGKMKKKGHGCVCPVLEVSPTGLGDSEAGKTGGRS